MIKALLYGASNVHFLEPFLLDEITALSYPGYTSEMLLKCVDEYVKDSYDLVFISAGTNDRGSLILEETLNNVHALVNHFKRQGSQVYVIELPNSPNINHQLGYHFNMVKIPKYHTQWYQFDGIHWNEAMAVEIVNRIHDILLNDLDTFDD